MGTNKRFKITIDKAYAFKYGLQCLISESLSNADNSEYEAYIKELDEYINSH